MTQRYAKMTGSRLKEAAKALGNVLEKKKPVDMVRESRSNKS